MSLVHRRQEAQMPFHPQNYMVAAKVMTVDGDGGGGQGRGRRQTNLCLEIPGLDPKKNLCSTMLW